MKNKNMCDNTIETANILNDGSGGGKKRAHAYESSEAL